MTTKERPLTKRLTFEVELSEHRLIKSMAAVQGIAVRDYMITLVRNDIKKQATNDETQAIIESLKEVASIKKAAIEKQSIKAFLDEL